MNNELNNDLINDAQALLGGRVDASNPDQTPQLNRQQQRQRHFDGRTHTVGPRRPDAPDPCAEIANCADHCGVPQADPGGPAALLDGSSVSGFMGS